MACSRRRSRNRRHRSKSGSRRRRKVNTVDPLTCDACEKESRNLFWTCCCWYLCWLLLIASILSILFFGLRHLRSNMCGISGTSPSDSQNPGNLAESKDPSNSPFLKIGTEAQLENDARPGDAVQNGWFSNLFTGNGNAETPSNDPSSTSGEGLGPSSFRNDNNDNRLDQNNVGTLDGSASKVTLQEENFSSCGGGAYIYRVHNFPPFRGMECDHGTHLVLESGEMEVGRFWKFHPVGDVEIRLAEPVQVKGFTIENPKNMDAKTVPKQIEFYGVEYDEKFRRTQTLFGEYTYTDYKKGQQKFLVDNPSSKKFDVIEFRFLNSQSNGENIHVYRVDVHGIP